MGSGFGKADNVHHFAATPASVSGDRAGSRVRAALIQILIEWVDDAPEPTEEYVMTVLERWNLGCTDEPPALLEYNATRVIPVVNQRLASEGRDTRVAPVNSKSGLLVAKIPQHDDDRD